MSIIFIAASGIVIGDAGRVDAPSVPTTIFYFKNNDITKMLALFSFVKPGHCYLNTPYFVT
jgi:hypothetical protein